MGYFLTHTDVSRLLDEIEPGLSQLSIADLVRRFQHASIFRANVARLAIIAHHVDPEDEDFRDILGNIASCRGMTSGKPRHMRPPHYYNQPYCPHCSKPTNSNWQRKLNAGELLQPGVVNCIGLRQGEVNTSANYRIQDGQRMTIPFSGLSNDDVGALTINIGVIRVNENICPIFDEMRSQYLQTMKAVGHMAYMRIESAVKRVGDLPDYLRETTYLSPWEAGLTDNEHVMMTHAHGLVHLDGKTHRTVGNAYRRHFPGARRVNMRTIKEEQQEPCGNYSHGAQGFAEYASMKKMSDIRSAPGSDTGDQAVDMGVIDGIMAEWQYRKQTKGARCAVRVLIPNKKPTPAPPATEPDQPETEHSSVPNADDVVTTQVLHPVSVPPENPFLLSEDVVRQWLRRFTSSIQGLTTPLYSPDFIAAVSQKTCFHLSAPCYKHPAPTRRKFPSVLPSYNWSHARKIMALVFKRFSFLPVKRPFKRDQEEEPP